MELDRGFAISASGLEAQRRRLDIISSNLANVQSTRTADGGPYRRRDVVFQSMVLSDAADQGPIGGTRPQHAAVEVSRVIYDRRPFKQVFEPHHPDANPEGYVRYPNVNPMEEMANMISALRAYEANVTAFNATKSMMIKTLEIGR